MNANLEHKNWQQKLGRWLSGDATRNDEAHLEKMAQSDSFLADAMEGYRSLPEGQHARKVTQLKAKLRQQNERKKGVAWLKIAAIGAFLIVAIFGLREYSQSVSNPDSVAQKENFSPPTMTATNPESQILPEEKESKKVTNDLLIKEQKTKKNATKKLPKNDSQKSKNTPKPENFSNSLANKSVEESLDEEVTANKEIINAKKSKDTINEEKLVELELADIPIKPIPPASPPLAASAPSPLDEEAFDEAYTPVILSNDSMNFAEEDDTVSMPTESNTLIGRVVKGKVLSEGGEPLIGANVIITGTPAGTVTDFEGDFMLQLPSDNSTIDIQYVGYQDIRVDLQDQNNISISMESAQTLDEVTVTGMGNKTKKSAQRNRKNFAVKEETNLNAAPVGGFIAFERYLNENMQLSENEAKNTTLKTVVVQFKIKKSGVLSDFKIIKSGGETCNAEAIRLLKEGPKWKTGIDTVTSYSIKCPK